MTEKGLRVLEVDKTFFGKLTNTLTKMLIPTRVGLNGVLITLKRNNLLKAFENANNDDIEDATKKAGYSKKYEDTYALYLEAIDKYIMDSIYKKVKNDTATEFEKEALSKYYAVVHLKETQYLEYKYRKQKYLLELDYETVNTSNKPKLMEKYKTFYVEKMDTFYKGILKNYSVQLADNIASRQTKENIYNSIFNTLEEYITQILAIKIEIDDDSIYKEIVEESQGKDVRLYGIDGMAEKRKVNHQSAIIRYLDREFFKEILKGTKVEAKATVQETIDDLLERARNLKNDFIDGIESDLLVIVADSKYRKSMKKILDELPNGTDPKEQAIGMYDSVRVYESTRMPAGVRVAVMIDGAIAQPYYVSEYGAEKVPFDDAVALEDYLYKGTQALMEDTIFYVQDETTVQAKAKSTTKTTE